MFLTLGFLFLGTIHYYQPHPAGYGLETSFNTASWIPISVFIGLGLGLVAISARFIYSRLTVLLTLAVGLLMIPLLYPQSSGFLETGRYYGLIAGLLLFVALQQSELAKTHLHCLLQILLSAVIIESVLGWSQYLFFEESNWMSYNTELGRPYGIFAQTNVMASFIATGIPLSAFLLSRIQASNNWDKFFIALCLLTPCLIVPLLFLLQSRVGWLGGLVAFGLMMPLMIRQMKMKSIATEHALAWFLSVFLGLLIGAFLLGSNPESLSSAASKLSSGGARTFIFPQVLMMVLDKPLLGVGIGNFEAAYNLFAAELFANGVTENAGYPNLHHPHNELLYWTAEGGVIPLAGLLLAAFAVFTSVLKAPEGMRLALVGLFFPVVLHTQTEYPFYHSVTHWVLFVVLICIVDAIGNESKVHHLKSTLLIGTPALLIPVVTAAFMITTLQAGAVLARHERFSDADPQELLDIANPVVWNQRLQWHVRRKMMFAGIRDQNLEPAYDYVNFVERSIDRFPRRESYQDLVFVYGFLGDAESERHILAQAEYRYPKVDFFRYSEGALQLLEYAVTQ